MCRLDLPRPGLARLTLGNARGSRTGANQVRGAVRLTGEQIHEAGEVLASAYADDPLMEYREPDEAKRQRWRPVVLSARQG